MRNPARKEKRRHPRRFVRWPIKVEAEHGTVGGETRNLSYDGIYIRCDEPLRINQDFRMAVLPPDRQAIGLTGKVVWADLYGLDKNENAFGMGVCLVEIADRDRRVFEEAVSARSGH
ncbi:MAG: PilZ domain-containing protein [Desulfatiglandales bacterium]